VKRGLEVGRELLKFLKKHNQEHHRKGIGLAANQLGINASVCVLLLDGLQLTLVNPEIVAKSAEQFIHEEGCLSLPGVLVRVPRHIWIVVKASNLKQERTFGVDLSRVTGKSYEEMLLEAACVSHECDHLSGKLITDYLV
jgi:peptide deformylase